MKKVIQYFAEFTLYLVMVMVVSYLVLMFASMVIKLFIKQIMKAKEKANELVESYLYTNNGLNILVDEYDGCITLYQAKECALICINEMINTLLPYAGLLDVIQDIKELKKIKKEINKL